MNVGQRKLAPTSMAKFGALGGIGGGIVGAAGGVVDKATDPYADFDAIQNGAIQGALYGLLGGAAVGGLYKAFDPFNDMTLKQSIFTNSQTAAEKLVRGVS